MPAPATHTLARLGLWLAIAAVCSIALGACGTRRPADIALTTPAIGWDAPTAVDIENFHGAVTVRVDPSLDEPNARAVLVASRRLHGVTQRNAITAINIETDTVEQDGRLILKLRTTTDWEDPEHAWANLFLNVPECDGIRVWNRGGQVHLVDVRGAIHVDNGAFAGRRGRIEVRTSRTITDPVSLSTTDGTVIYQVGAQSTGRMELSSGDRPVELFSRASRVQYLHSDGRTARIVVNHGENPVMLHSGRGLVRASILDDPLAYRNLLR